VVPFGPVVDEVVVVPLLTVDVVAVPLVDV
jgi:hypothetical protein